MLRGGRRGSVLRALEEEMVSWGWLERRGEWERTNVCFVFWPWCESGVVWICWGGDGNGEAIW